MLDKKLIEKNFKKSITTYSANAIVQKQMADEVIKFIKNKKYVSILEIGSYTGILTEKIVKNVEFEKYLAVDIVDSFDFIKKLNGKIEFKKCDIESFTTKQKFDLIVSNASLQWCEDFNLTLKKLKKIKNKNGQIIISIFGKKNLIEIKNTFNIGLNYKSVSELKKDFKNAKIIEKEYCLEFENPLEILRHLKLTGVNSISKNPFKISEIKEKLKTLEVTYKNKLTYNPIYIIID